MNLINIKITISLWACVALAVLSVAAATLQPRSDSLKLNSTSHPKVKHFLSAGWRRLALNLKSREGDIQLSTLTSNNQLRDGLLHRRCMRLISGLSGRRETPTADQFKTDFAYELPDGKSGEPVAADSASRSKAKAKSLGTGSDRLAIERCIIGLGKPRNLKATNIYKLVLTLNNKAMQQTSLNDTLASALTKLKSTLLTLGQIQANN